MANRIPPNIQAIVRQMTNWQRNQWARAKYPIEIQKVQSFLHLKKPTDNRKC